MTTLDWKTLGPRPCDRCKAQMPLTRISFGWDVTDNPTLILGWQCSTECGAAPVEIRGMRDGGIAIEGASLTAERIEPPTAEDRRAFDRADRRGREEVRDYLAKKEKAAAKKIRAERKRMVKK